MKPWRVTLVDTDENTLTGRRLYRVVEYIKNDDTFFTNGDGVDNVDITKELAFHKSHRKLELYWPFSHRGRYDALQLKGTSVQGFTEKPRGDGGLINGGFLILSPKCIDLIKDDRTSWEGHPLAKLASDSQLQAFEHSEFWQTMDTLRDKTHLENCGLQARRLGKLSSEFKFLERQTRSGHWS